MRRSGVSSVGGRGMTRRRDEAIVEPVVVVVGGVLVVDLEVAAAVAGPLKRAVGRALAGDGLRSANGAVLAVLDGFDAAAEAWKVRSGPPTVGLLGCNRTSGDAARVMTIAEAADELHHSQSYVRRLVKAGRLPMVRARRPMLVDAVAVETWRAA